MVHYYFYGDIPPLIAPSDMIPGIKVSLQDREDMIREGYWVRLDVAWFPIERSVARLTYGLTRTDGTREPWLATRTYFEDGSYAQ